ncbi:MAG TPA: pilus assembly protein TadG-related protein [Bryobacteraceae bacterium]|nr:pilus assembly protein TadG-related protein [Bryobacteraceae bacterium]
MRPSRLIGSRRGQAGLLVILSLFVLFSVLGLAGDLGWAYYKRQSAQTAADAAAMAAANYAKLNGYSCGVNGVLCGTTYTCAGVTPPTNDLEAGCLYAASNGYSSGVTMTANSSSSPVSGNSPAYWVKSNITESVSTWFLGFRGIGASTINVEAVAGVSVTPVASCIYVLDPSAAGAFSMSGTSSVSASCGVYINSSSSSALRMSGSSRLNSSQILITGDMSRSGTSVASPTPRTGQAPFANPLSSLTTPSFSGCDYTNYSTSSSATLYPGVYCGGIKISGSGAVTFTSGLYILNGGGMVVSGSGSVSGSGVAFFNTGQNGYTIAPISTSGSTTYTLTAPTSGTYQGMLFMQDPNLTYSGANTITGSSRSVMSGTLYFPTTGLTYTGSTSGSYTAIVARTVIFTGTSNILNDPSGQYTGLATRAASLIQ